MYSCFAFREIIFPRISRNFRPNFNIVFREISCFAKFRENFGKHKITNFAKISRKYENENFRSLPICNVSKFNSYLFLFIIFIVKIYIVLEKFISHSVRPPAAASTPPSDIWHRAWRPGSRAGPWWRPPSGSGTASWRWCRWWPWWTAIRCSPPWRGRCRSPRQKLWLGPRIFCRWRRRCKLRRCGQWRRGRRWWPSWCIAVRRGSFLPRNRNRNRNSLFLIWYNHKQWF